MSSALTQELAPSHVQPPCEMLLALAKPHLALDHTQVRHASKLCCMTYDMLQQRFAAFVSEHRSCPVAFTFSNDPTPISVKKHIVMKDHDGSDVRRSGGKSLEFLIQRVWAEVLDGSSTVAFPPPPHPTPYGEQVCILSLLGLARVDEVPI